MVLKGPGLYLNAYRAVAARAIIVAQAVQCGKMVHFLRQPQRRRGFNRDRAFIRCNDKPNGPTWNSAGHEATAVKCQRFDLGVLFLER